MADKHPYTSSVSGLVQAVIQFRKMLPATVTADTLKKLAISPNNETYLINVLRFIGVVDAENKKTAKASAIFNKHDDTEFAQAFAGLVEKAYSAVFDLHGPGAWDLTQSKLIGFFRQHDGTSDIVGKRQAATFQTLASLSGKAAPVADPGPPKPSTPKAPKPAKPAATATKPGESKVEVADPKIKLEKPDASPMALTVRVEINLPPGGDQATYDAIFRSIRENLLNGNGA